MKNKKEKLLISYVIMLILLFCFGIFLNSENIRVLKLKPEFIIKSSGNDYLLVYSSEMMVDYKGDERNSDDEPIIVIYI